MAMYATPSELASYLQQDLDTATATLVLQVVSARFAELAHTRFEVTAVTYRTLIYGSPTLVLPFWPIVGVTAVRVNGVAVLDYTRVDGTLYRVARFGSCWSFPPDVAEADLTHGFAAAPDDVKGAVLESAGLAYQNPDRVMSESIDDYQVRYAAENGGVRLSVGAVDLAEYYAGVAVG